MLKIIDTLHIVIDKPNKMEWTYDELNEEIKRQVYNFNDKMGYWPTYVNMEIGLYLHLIKEISKLCEISYDPGMIYGATITTRNKEIVKVLSDREIVCL